MSIQIEQMTKTYGSQKAIDNISFSTGSNRIIGFLGPNGAGKSTTMKILTGILPFDSGKISVNGINPQENTLAAKSQIGYLPENNPLYLDMYVYEILEFEANVHQIKNKASRIKEVIQATGLEREQHKKAEQLSKGYKQRLGLAMAIIHDPKVLILDEPTSGLDPNQILEIRTLIKELGKEKTVLLSTHIMQEVEAICEEVIIIDKGILKEHILLSQLQEKYPSLSMEQVFTRLTESN